MTTFHNDIAALWPVVSAIPEIWDKLHTSVTPASFLAMGGGVIKSRRTRRPRLRSPKLWQEKLLDAVVAGDGIGKQCPHFSEEEERY
jgi:hypothetical protein